MNDAGIMASGPIKSHASITARTPRRLRYAWLWNGAALTRVAGLIFLEIFVLLLLYSMGYALPGFATVLYNYISGTTAICLEVIFARALYFRSYRKPRRSAFMVGMTMALTQFVIVSFFGYVLPYGQMGFWLAKVVTNIVPEKIAIFLLSSPLFTLFTSTTQYPALLKVSSVIIMGVPCWLLWRAFCPKTTVLNEGGYQDIVRTARWREFCRAWWLAAVVLIDQSIFWISASHSHMSPGARPPAPTMTPPTIVPEWYFLPFYAILRLPESKLCGVMLMFGSLWVWALLPLLDVGWRDRHGRLRLRAAWAVFVLDLVVLGICGAHPMQTVWWLIACAGTVYYFMHFLIILPLLGL